MTLAVRVDPNVVVPVMVGSVVVSNAFRVGVMALELVAESGSNPSADPVTTARMGYPISARTVT